MVLDGFLDALGVNDAESEAERWRKARNGELNLTQRQENYHGLGAAVAEQLMMGIRVGEIDGDMLLKGLEQWGVFKGLGNALEAAAEQIPGMPSGDDPNGGMGGGFVEDLLESIPFVGGLFGQGGAFDTDGN